MSVIRHPQRARGFGLVELMVAMVVGLVITGAAVAFVASMTRTNNQTMASVRLNAELRSAAEIVAREIRRARFVADPISDIGTGCNLTNTCRVQTIQAINVTADCIRFAYDTPTGDRRFQAIRVNNGALRMGWANNAAVACDSATTQVSSQLVTLAAPAGGAAFEAINANSIRIRMSGTLANAPDVPAKTYTAVIAVRSGGV